MYELMYNLFVTSKYQPSGLRAKNINTIDEVPDSSWFTNRVGARPVDDRRAGARRERRRAARSVEVGADPGEDVGRASRVHGDGREGRDLVPRVRSAARARKAPPRPSRSRRKIFWALGYNQVESFLTTFDPKKASIDPKATVRRPNGKTNPVHARRRQRHSRERRAQCRWHLSRHRRPAAARKDSRRLPVRRHAPRRSQRSRAARAPARAACAARVRRVDQPHRPQGQEHARHAGHGERQDASSSITCRTSARRSACATTCTSGT